MITRNVEVPGIEEIPKTVLEHGSSKVDKTPKRKKPWEKDDDNTEGQAAATATQTSSAGVGKEGGGERAKERDADRVDVNGHRETGQGVANILRPNAVPDSGLLSKE